jgi:hypothetical protein
MSRYTPREERRANASWRAYHAFLNDCQNRLPAGAEVLDDQGEEILAGEVRYFAKHLPPVLTDRQQLAAKFLRFKGQQRRAEPQAHAQANPRDQERTL